MMPIAYNYTTNTNNSNTSNHKLSSHTGIPSFKHLLDSNSKFIYS